MIEKWKLLRFDKIGFFFECSHNKPDMEFLNNIFSRGFCALHGAKDSSLLLINVQEFNLRIDTTHEKCTESTRET
jgi:hypothetical protein